MSRTTSAFLSVAIFATSLAIVASPAKADYRFDPVYLAANDYREAVRHFETLSDRFHCLDRYTETAIDRLNGVASSLRAAAKNPDNIGRLLDRFYEAGGLHNRIDVGLQSNLHVAAPLVAAWTDVQRAFAVIETQLRGPVVGPGYGTSVPPVNSVNPYLTPGTAWPSSGLGNQTFVPGAGLYGARRPSLPDNVISVPTAPIVSPFARQSIAIPRFPNETTCVPAPIYGPRQFQHSRTSDIVRIGADLMRLFD